MNVFNDDKMFAVNIEIYSKILSVLMHNVLCLVSGMLYLSYL